MAATILALRKLNQRRAEGDDADEGLMLDSLTARLPPKETWDSEHFLGVLVLG
jgi:hypothetical protein